MRRLPRRRLTLQTLETRNCDGEERHGLRVLAEQAHPRNFRLTAAAIHLSRSHQTLPAADFALGRRGDTLPSANTMRVAKLVHAVMLGAPVVALAGVTLENGTIPYRGQI